MTRLMKLGCQLHALAAMALILAAAGTAHADVKIGVFGPMTGDAAWLRSKPARGRRTRGQ